MSLSKTKVLLLHMCKGYAHKIPPKAWLKPDTAPQKTWRNQHKALPTSSNIAWIPAANSHCCVMAPPETGVLSSAPANRSIGLALWAGPRARRRVACKRIHVGQASDLEFCHESNANQEFFGGSCLLIEKSSPGSWALRQLFRDLTWPGQNVLSKTAQEMSHKLCQGQFK